MQKISGTESELSKEQKYLSKQKEQNREEKRTQSNTSTIRLNRQKYCNISPQSDQNYAFNRRVSEGGYYQHNQHHFSSKQLANSFKDRYLYDFGQTQRSTQLPEEDQRIQNNPNFIAQFQRRIQEKMRPLQQFNNPDEYLNFLQTCEETIQEADDQNEELDTQQYYPSNHQLRFRGANLQEQQQHWEYYDPTIQPYCEIQPFQQDFPSTPLKYFAAASNKPAAIISSPSPYQPQQSPLLPINQQFINNRLPEKPSATKWVTLSKQKPTQQQRETMQYQNNFNFQDNSPVQITLIGNNKNNHMQQQPMDDYKSKQFKDQPQKQQKLKGVDFELMNQATTIDPHINLSAFRGRKNTELSAQKKNEVIRIKDFEFSLASKIGEGSFSTVYLGRSLTNPAIQVAVKVIDLSKQGSKFKDEIQICMKVNGHQNILRIYDHYIDKPSNKCYLFLEFCRDGSLQGLLPKISRRQAIVFFRQIMDGMLELHRHQIIHRDIKLENILLCEADVKISDFGLSKLIANNQLEVNSIKCGTPSTMAPEIYFSRHDYPSYSSKCDVWSLGVILHEMFYKIHPFDMDKENLRKCQRVQVQNKCQIVEDFLAKSLVHSQSQRIGLKSILSHSIYTAELSKFNLLETNKNRFYDEKQISPTGVIDQAARNVLPSVSFQLADTIVLPPIKAETQIRQNIPKEKRTTVEKQQQNISNQGQQQNSFLAGFGLDKNMVLSFLLLLVILTFLSIILPKILKIL